MYQSHSVTIPGIISRDTGSGKTSYSLADIRLLLRGGLQLLHKIPVPLSHDPLSSNAK
jgi:hypothetical protein